MDEEHFKNYGKFYNEEELKDFRVWKFNLTKPLSTYLYAIVAGPYFEIKGSDYNFNFEVPMSLYCRESLAEHLKKDANEIFELTTEGMKFYEKL